MDVESLKAFGTVMGFVVGLPTLLVIFKVGMGWGALSKAVTDIAGSLSSLSLDVTSLKSEVAKWGERAAVLESKVETVRGDVASLRESRHEHGNQIHSSRGQLGVHEQRLDGHDSEIADLRQGPTDRRKVVRPGSQRRRKDRA